MFARQHTGMHLILWREGGGGYRVSTCAAGQQTCTLTLMPFHVPRLSAFPASNRPLLSATANFLCDPHQTTTTIPKPTQAQHNPVVIIPGGPGLPHDYLETLEGAAKDDRLVVLFDPIGTGNSTALPADVVEKPSGLLGTSSLIAQVTWRIRERCRRFLAPDYKHAALVHSLAHRGVGGFNWKVFTYP